MRFRDFQIVITGDFDTAQDEAQLRQGIAAQLAGALAGTKSPATPEQLALDQIDSGTARWSPPLQQHLDVVKQSLLQNFPIAEDQGSDLQERAQALTQGIGICRECGDLVMDSSLGEKYSAAACERVRQHWRPVLERYRPGAATCSESGKTCRR